MNVTVGLEHRFDRAPDGTVWTQGAFEYPFWHRYLEVFEQVCVVARAREVATAQSGWRRADGERVTFTSLPYYLGPSQYIFKARQVRRAVRAAMATSEAVILRVPGVVGSLAFGYLRADKHPFGLEVIGDPYDVFSPGAVRHPLRSYFRWQFSRQLRRQCAEACAVAYVTEEALQRRYPPVADAFTTHYSSISLGDEAFTTHYSDIELRNEAFADLLRPMSSSTSMLKIVTIGSLAQLYKAPDVLIEAIAKCSNWGLDIELVFIGDGKHRAGLQARSKALGLGERVRFLGQLPPGEAVHAQLDQADLFVLPSRTEGLPRAMIEAMARGLPCIGSTVGGIPELLPPEDMVTPGDAAALALKIREVTANPERLARMAARNLEEAKEYREEILRERRISFYECVREETEVWLKKRR